MINSDQYKIKLTGNKFVIKEKGSNYTIDLRKRLFDFAVESIKFLVSLPKEKEFDVFRYQYSKSATSIGANYEEAQSSTYSEFISKTRIALREANESLYFLKIMDELNIGNDKQIKHLLSECPEICRILGSIVSKAHKNR